jgi:hypothetical protein
LFSRLYHLKTQFLKKQKQKTLPKKCIVACRTASS